MTDYSNFKESALSGDSDEFVLPVAPPTPKAQSSSNHCEPNMPVTSKSINDSESEITESMSVFSEPSQESSGKIPVGKDSWSPRSMDDSSEKADTERQIDDHPLVAIVLIILTVIGTIFCGFALVSTGSFFFLLPLVAIFGFAIDFFRKKTARSKNRALNNE